MKPAIHGYLPGKEFATEERCHINELSNSSDDPGLSVARARVEPGVCTRWHRLRDTAERYCIVSGMGCVEVGNLGAHQVGPGDVVLIPPGVRQRIRNTGPEDLVFLAICTPRFSSLKYQDLEDS